MPRHPARPERVHFPRPQVAPPPPTPPHPPTLPRCRRSRWTSTSPVYTSKIIKIPKKEEDSVGRGWGDLDLTMKGVGALVWCAAAVLQVAGAIGAASVASAAAPLGERRLRRQQQQWRRGRGVRAAAQRQQLELAKTAASVPAPRQQTNLLELRQDPMMATDACFQRHQLDCGSCTKDPACGVCTNEHGQRKCMEGGRHGPSKCHLEDCRSWIYTSCNSAGIVPTTCHEDPLPAPPKPAPRAPKEPTAPVEAVKAVPPRPAPVEDSIIPGLAREEHIETVTLEEEKHPSQLCVEQSQTMTSAMRSWRMLSTQPIRDEIARVFGGRPDCLSRRGKTTAK